MHENEIKTRKQLIEAFKEYFIDPYIIKNNQKEYLNLKHIETESSNVIPQDETLLFVNSGMVQFKENLLNPTISKLKRTFSIQKCIRAGGKHNDLEDVGMDSYHHTFFEMMGNWSFGDYFKKESIFMAFTFLKKLGLNEKQMYVTYFCKDTAIKEVLNKYLKENEIESAFKDLKKNKSNLNEEIMKELSLLKDLKTDEETKNVWKSLISEDRIIPAGIKDNFWEMADTGPCGPCTEIHYDRLNKNAKHLVNTDQNDVIEIWNLVFIQYYRKESKELELLEQKSVDTGMGLERVLGILNDGTNYDTHLFQDIFNLIKKGDIINNRIIADHCRTLAVSLFYNIDFSNTGRGYVLRRIIRRLLLSYFELKIEVSVKDLIKKAAESLEIKIREEEFEKIDEEIMSFQKTLKKGTKKLHEILKQKDNIKYLESNDIFDLTTTYGLPLDYLKDICRNKNIILNFNEYDDLMHKFKKLSMKNKIKSINLTQKEIFRIENELKETEECFEMKEIQGNLKFIKFLNEMYSFEEMKDKDVSEYENIPCALIFDKTNFYSEKGGQIGDSGIIKNEFAEIEILDTQKQQNYALLMCNFNINIFKNHAYAMIYDDKRREKIRKNHTATHLLNYCLLKNTNKESIQAGSLVSDDKLRFDYEISDKYDFKEIEREINELIKKESKVEIIEKRKEELNEIKDFKLTKLKTEKYPEIVRIIRIEDLESAELCGGTHVKNTKEIQKFVFHTDSSVSKGIRRIVAYTGEKAENFLEEFETKFNSCKTLKELEKIPEKSIPLNYKSLYNLKKQEIQKTEALKSKNFYKRISQIVKESDFTENIKLEIRQKEEEFVSEKDFSKQFNKLNGILMQKIENKNISIFLKGLPFEGNKIYFILMGEVEEIKEDLIRKFNAKLNKAKDCYIGSYLKKE